MPSYTFIDESIDYSDYDCARCAAIAAKITAIENEAEQRSFRAQSDYEDGRYYDPTEDCECESCLAGGAYDDCESVKENLKREAEQDLELEMLQDKLTAMGARMMRPYEHWNEDERYMEYMENRSDY